MPIHAGQDEKGHYYIWGEHGHRYYFNPNDPKSADEAYRGAANQARAAYSRGYKGHGK